MSYINIIDIDRVERQLDELQKELNRIEREKRCRIEQKILKISEKYYIIKNPDGSLMISPKPIKTCCNILSNKKLKKM